MIDIGFYAVTPEVAQRAGLQGQRYKTADGEYILDNKDLERITLTSQEFLTGIQGIRAVTQEEAERLIAEGKYQLGGETETADNAEVTNEETEGKEDEL